jgi:aryl-alcohol dehydrogenase-like predicted oxidoreductase
MKIGLGTVQFGVDYGISNLNGKTALDEVGKILDVAESAGILTIDTAANYGDSEAVLGAALKKGANFNIVTKTPGFDKNLITQEDALFLERTFRASLIKLKVPATYGLMVHHGENLLSDGGEHLMEMLLKLKDEGIVKKIGASVYNAREIEGLLKKYMIDIVQLPINVLDQRLLTSGTLMHLKRAGVEIHARSAFLQGLLLMEPDQLPAHFSTVVAQLKSFRVASAARNLSPVQAALGFPLGLKEIDAVICGVNDHEQLQDICTSARAVESEFYEQFSFDDERILNPSCWKL